MPIFNDDGEIPLLAAYPAIQRLVLSCIDKHRFPYTRTQFTILSVLTRQSTLYMSQIADQINASHEQATRSVAPLADDGLVERYVDPHNRKMVHIKLTERGAAFMSDFRVHFREALRGRLREKLDQGEIDRLAQAAGTLAELLEKL